MKSRNNEQNQIDVLQIIDSQGIGAFQIKLIVLCALVAMFDGFDVQSIAFVAPDVAQAFGINIKAFGPIFSAGLVGMAAGALMIGPLADRFGRKRVIIASTISFGLFSLLTAFADSTTTLIIARLLTGLGLGAAMPNIISLTSEYAPKRVRTMLVTVMFLGFPLGAVVGGLISSVIIPIWGWQSVFIFGGVAPLILSAFLLLSLPESVRFLVNQQAQSSLVLALLKKAVPKIHLTSGAAFYINEEQVVGAPLKNLFTGGRVVGTLLLWVPFFMNLLLLFFMYNWLPPVLQQAGLPISKAIIATVLFNFGGVVGGVVMAYLIDRLGPLVVLGVAYAMGAISVAMIGMVSSTVTSIMWAVFISGIFVVGAQFGANALAASFYPTRIRSTGVSWALGVGRFGSILGPLIGGYLLTLNLPFADLFLIAAIPAGIASLALLMFHFATRSRTY